MLSVFSIHKKIILKDIDKMDVLFRQSIHLAEQGLKQCAEWRRELEEGKPKAFPDYKNLNLIESAIKQIS